VNVSPPVWSRSTKITVRVSRPSPAFCRRPQSDETNDYSDRGSARRCRQAGGDDHVRGSKTIDCLFHSDWCDYAGPIRDNPVFLLGISLHLASATLCDRSAAFAVRLPPRVAASTACPARTVNHPWFLHVAVSCVFSAACRCPCSSLNSSGIAVSIDAFSRSRTLRAYSGMSCGRAIPPPRLRPAALYRSHVQAALAGGGISRDGNYGRAEVSPHISDNQSPARCRGASNYVRIMPSPVRGHRARQDSFQEGKQPHLSPTNHCANAEHMNVRSHSRFRAATASLVDGPTQIRPVVTAPFISGSTNTFAALKGIENGLDVRRSKAEHHNPNTCDRNEGRVAVHSRSAVVPDISAQRLTSLGSR